MPKDTTWSLEIDLQKLSAKTSMPESLAALGIISTPTQDYRLQLPEKGWYRAGAESYVYPFSVLANDGRTDLILKACIAFSAAQSLENILQSWIGRRELVSLNGINTPHLYAWGHGIILEEEVPLTFEKAMREHCEDPYKLLTDAARVAGIITRLGFQPIALFKDLRSHGDDAVMVDFGQDLGPSSNNSTTQSDTVLQDLFKTIEAWGVQLDRGLEYRLRRTFLSEIEI